MTPWLRAFSLVAALVFLLAGSGQSEAALSLGMSRNQTLRFFEPGLVVAVLYFAMSCPLSLLARRLENALKGEPHPGAAAGTGRPGPADNSN